MECKICSFTAFRQAELLKHYRLRHGQSQSLPCLHSNCSCSFKTWGSLKAHLSRQHAVEKSVRRGEVLSLKCEICSSRIFSTEKSFFEHLGNHLKKHETVLCVFDKCGFRTSIYGTFASHRSRKHSTHSLDDFRSGIVRKYVDQSHTLEDDVVHEEEETSTEELKNLIEQKIGHLLLKLECIYNVSQKCISEVVEELQFVSGSVSGPFIRDIVNSCLSKHGCVVDEVIISDLVKDICETNPINSAFRATGPFATAYKRKEFFKKNFSVVEPVEYILDAKKGRSFQYVPILQSLLQVLRNKDIQEKALRTRQTTSSGYEAFYDGTHFKENACLSGDELTLSLVLYVDDFEVCNPLGTSRKKHKITAVYWVLANVPAQFRSTLTSIYLAVLCKAVDIKTYGYGKVLEPLLKDLAQLEEDGLFIPELGKILKGTVFCVSADNLGAHSIAGFVESFSATHFCRFCLAELSQIQVKEVRTGTFQPRTKQQHSEHIQTVLENRTLTHCYGVKRQCVLTENLKYFHVLSGYPPDVLHDFFEGILPLELKLCLRVLIKKKYFSLLELNNLIKQFPYKWNDKTDCPQSIRLDLEKRTIGGNGHENWCLLRLLPFIIGTKIPFGEPSWQILLDLKDIVELVVAPRHTEETICYLDTKISEHRQRFLDVFPQENLTPKHHFIEHYPLLIKAFGPLVALWTMRFEGKHRFFKRIVRQTNSFRNFLLSLAVKHQLMLSYHLHATDDIRPAISVTKLSTVPLEVLKDEIKKAIQRIYPEETCVQLANSVSCRGITYSVGMILPHGSTGGLPDFVEILFMIVVQGELALVVQCQDAWYHEHFRGFELESTERVQALKQKELTDIYPLAAYPVGQKRMVSLKRIYLSKEADMSARLCVYLDKTDARRLTLPTGIPATVAELNLLVQETFQLQGDFFLQYLDADFRDQFFTLTDTADIKDKDTIRVVYPDPPVITLNVETVLSDDACSSGSRDTVLLSSPGSSSSGTSSSKCTHPWSQRSRRWPSEFEIPCFAYDTELLLKTSNEEYMKNGTALNSASVKSDILEKLAETIFQFTAYPTSLQLSQVAEALVQKHPCLKEPGSWSGFNGWHTSLKFKMANYRSKLRAIGCAEVEVNSVKRKADEDRSPAKNIKKPRKAEVNYLPPRPIGETEETLERERVDLLSEVQKRDNCVGEKMAKTFSYRRKDVVQALPVKDLKERWPALFEPTQIEEEFRRITTVPLESTFMRNLDKYTPKLLDLFKSKGGAVRTRLQSILEQLYGSNTIERRRDCVIRGLITYLGERVEDLIKDYKDADDTSIREDLVRHTLTLFVVKELHQDPEYGICIEGAEVLAGIPNFTQACTLLMGLIYGLNLSYPEELKYTFEVFQKLMLELHALKTSPKVTTLKTKLLS